MEKLNKALLVLFLLVLAVSAVSISGRREGPIIVMDKARVTVVDGLEEIVNNEIESGYYELLRYQETNVLIFDFLNRNDQNMALGRMTLFIEDADYTGEIVSIEILKSKRSHLLAHDLKIGDIVIFFNEAEETNTELTHGEKELKKILMSLKLIEKEFGVYSATSNSAVISLHHDEDFMDYRGTMISHEIQHGLDFTSPQHWRQTKAKWNSLSEEEKETFKKFLLNVGIYDVDDLDLVMTEFRAFTHTRGTLNFEWYVNRLVENKILTEYESELLKGLTLSSGFWGNENVAEKRTALDWLMQTIG